MQQQSLPKDLLTVPGLRSIARHDFTSNVRRYLTLFLHFLKPG